MAIERFKITDRNSWLAMRAVDLTASDIGAALGIDPHKSALKLFAEKTGQLMADPDNKLMRRGRWLEPAVIEALQEEYPHWVIERPRIYLRDPINRIGATPDALADLAMGGGIVNVQCKVVSKPVFERDWQEGPPMNYVLQTLTEGMLLDAASSKLAALVLDTYSAELHVFDVERHQTAEERVVAIAGDFWRRVAEGRPPPVDYGRDAEVVKQMYPTSVAGPSLDLSSDNRLPELLERREAAKEIIKIESRVIEEIEVEVKAKLGEHETAHLDGWKLSWKSQSRKEQVVPASSFRVLRVTDMREKEKAA